MSHDPFEDAPPEILDTEAVPPVPPRAHWFAPADAAARRKLAWMVAIGADALQLALLPLFPAEWLLGDVIDVVVGVIMFRLLGWHFAFLPSIAVKLLPVVDVVPTWTMAVWVATRKKLPQDAAPPAPTTEEP